jgi:hypothetical protein
MSTGVQPQPHAAAAAAASAYIGRDRVPAEHALASPANQKTNQKTNQSQSQSQNHNQTLRARRRSSLPPSTRSHHTTPALAVDTSARPSKKRSPNCARSTAASPEVISSLIDQLSAISASTQQHFEHHLPAAAYAHAHAHSAASLPTSPSPRPPSLSDPRHGSFDARSPYYSAIRDQNDLFPDDACEPPVVRTSKPPSGLSPMTAPPKQRKDKTHSLSNYMGRSPGSSASIHSCHSARSSSSFGNITIDPGVLAAKPVAGGSNRSSVESKRSVKRPTSLMYMSSRERLKQKEADTRKRIDDAVSPDSPRKPASQLFSYEDTIKEEPLARDDHEQFVIAEPPRFTTRYPSRNASPARRIRMNLVDGSSGDSPIEQGLVPDRGSSLRHSSPSKKSRKSSSTKSKDRGKENERPKTIAASVPETQEMDPEEARKQKLLMELEQEENEVAQRIKQLREQKLLRDKMAGKMPADDHAGAAVVKPHVSALPSHEPPPAPEERGHDYFKAHEPLPISRPHVGRSSTEPSLDKPLPSIEHHAPKRPTRPAPPPPQLRHLRHRSLTVNDGDDLSLPINYALALKSLDESAPNSPRPPRVDSTHIPPPPSISIASTAETSSIRDTVKRSSSLSVGGRSAFGRKANSMAMSTSKGHKHSASLTEERPPAFRAASEEISSGRHSSLSMASASHSFSLQQKRTLKKKRWSHPDLPAKAEKAHNDKVDATEAATAAAASRNTVIDERPTSLDSVDMDVDNYLHAPRLSQKIRHPQTGRIISFSEVGDPNGYAIFVCVGMGLTRFVMAFYDQLAATLKLRLITPERPGIGGSQVDPNGTPLTWPGKF